MGCGLAAKRIRGRTYLYFWEYRSQDNRRRRRWTYVGPAGQTRTIDHAAALLLAYHLRARDELDRRIRTLLSRARAR
ncbi:MAG: hypothetical protein E6K06_08865 [Methanobacteriota archaeon]|nr:MAG: hypothetical protein E6K09_07395 [Euryarchaeota archaeon]TLZ69775.1 MAG: hypothetical protein E6K06_08865 [Euryarchaeota archaeon]